MSKYFPKPKSFGTTTSVDASNFAKKTNLSSLKSDVGTSDIAKFKKLPSNLSNLKSKVDKLDIGKLETTPVDLSKLSNVKNVVENTEYDELVKKVIQMLFRLLILVI